MGSTGEHGSIEFRLLGAFEVASDGRTLEIGSPKQRRLLAMLALNLNRPVALDALVEELWGDCPPASVSTNLHSLVSRLRRAVSDLGGSGGARLRSRDAGYVLEADPKQVDANRFEDLVGRGRDALAHGDPSAAAALLREALALWRGPALADLADREFARLEATRLDEVRLDVVEELAEAELARGRPADALGLLESHVASHATRERAWGQLMVALYRLGRQAEALQAYQEVRRVLGEELGLEPTPALRRLEQKILLQSADLEASADRASIVQAEAGGPGPLAVRQPGDTRAFLFTDIEASTRRWEGELEAMAGDLARHDQLLRQAVEAAGGHVFSHTGDGLCAAFPTASAALVAAVAGQQALTAQRWVGTAPLRVRMAVHAGAAEHSRGTYLGPTLNRTARLLALASGSQVLCSHAAADLARDALPADVVLLDLGDHRLADLSRPERVFQVTHPHLPSVFAPVRSPDVSRHNLPLSLTSFVGRAQELEEIDSLLRTSRLITFVGLGGAGKTRLALEAAGRALERFPEGVWLVELGHLKDPALMPSEVAGAVGLLTDVIRSSRDGMDNWLCECLRPRHLLLIMDNCEHLVEATAQLVHKLLSRCPQVTVLATSREVLGLPGELVWTVPPLSLPEAEASPRDLAISDAVTLFCERARAVQPGFGLNAANAGAIAEICRHLDGIPLALELAAARIRVLGAQQVAERVDQRFRLLTGGSRTTVPRHQTLRAAMDWSYELLPPAEQAALRRLAVFPGSFDLEAAEEVVGEPEHGLAFEVVDLLSRLVEKSLVLVQHTGADVRYRLLETVREYGSEKLAEANEYEATQRRHRDCFLQLTADWQRDPASGFWGTGPWIQGAKLEEDNLRRALEWSLAQGEHDAALQMLASLSIYWLFVGPVDARDWLERALAGASSGSPQRVEALLGLALTIEQQGDRPVAETIVREALELAEQRGDAEAMARARLLLALRVLGRGGHDEARRLLTAALEGYEAMGNVPGIGHCHYELGCVAVADGDLGVARSHFERSLEIVRRNEASQFTEAHALAALAPLLALAGEAEQAVGLAQEAVAIARDLQLRFVLVMALSRASETTVLSGAPERARTVLRELLALLRELGTDRWVADSVEAAGLVLEGTGQVEAAARLLGACEALRQALGEPPGGQRAISSEVRRCRERLARTLGPARFTEQEALGRSLSVAEATSCALEWLEPSVLTAPGEKPEGSRSDLPRPGGDWPGRA